MHLRQSSTLLGHARDMSNNKELALPAYRYQLADPGHYKVNTYLRNVIRHSIQNNFVVVLNHSSGQSTRLIESCSTMLLCSLKLTLTMGKLHDGYYLG